MVFECYNCKQPNAEGDAICSGCGATLEVAGYRICGVLGQGGCGAVYTADALPLAAQRGAVSAGQQVALKQSFDPASLTQLQREFAVLNNLRHPNLPRYYEVRTFAQVG